MSACYGLIEWNFNSGELLVHHEYVAHSN